MRSAFRRSLALKGIAILGALLVAAGPWAAAKADHAPGHAAVLNLRVEVSHKGFNGNPDFTIEAEQGQQVNISFVWADTVLPDNTHRIYINGFELNTDLLDSENREQTLRFLADKPGTFEVVCVWPCEGHKNLQKAQLKVKAGGAGSADASFVATSLAVTPSAWEVESGPVTLTATLRDTDGAPIANAPVRFYVEAEFADTEGQMEIGSAETDADGIASLAYTPTFPGDQTVTARFEGFGLYSESEQAFQLQVLSADPAYSVSPTGLERLRDWAPLGVGLVVLAVWATFAYVLYQVYHIRRARS